MVAVRAGLLTIRSSTPVTVTVWGVLQMRPLSSFGSKSRKTGHARAAPGSRLVTVTGAVGSVSRTTV